VTFGSVKYMAAIVGVKTTRAEAFPLNSICSAQKVDVLSRAGSFLHGRTASLSHTVERHQYVRKDYS